MVQWNVGQHEVDMGIGLEYDGKGKGDAKTYINTV